MARLVHWTLIVLAGCGRLGFGEVAGGDATGPGDGSPDVGGDTSALDPSLVLAVDFEVLPAVDRVTGQIGECTSCPMPGSGHAGGQAGSFSGAQCIGFSDRPALRTAEITIAVWVKPSGNIEQTVTTKPSDSLAATSNSWEMVVSNLNLDYPSWSGQYDPWATGVALADGTWQHLAFTYGAGEKRVYVNGVLRGMKAANAFMFGSDPLLVGCDLNNGLREGYYTGSIDDLLVYRRVLSATEIAALAQ